MVDLLLLLALLLFALARSFRSPPRAGVLCAGLTLFSLILVAYASLAGWYGRRFFQFGMSPGISSFAPQAVGSLSGVWIFVLYGPGALPGASSLPLSASMAQWTAAYRFAVPVLSAAVAAYVAWTAAQREIRESEGEDRLMRLSLAHAACAMVGGLTSTVFALASALSEP